MHIKWYADVVQTKSNSVIHPYDRVAISLQDLIRSLSPTKALKEYFVRVYELKMLVWSCNSLILFNLLISHIKYIKAKH